MKRMSLLVVTMAALGGVASAASISSDFAKIQHIDKYAGDTTVFLEKNPPGCEQGFWMRPSHAGFQDRLYALEKAAHQNSRVKIIGDDAELWKRLAERNCRLDKVEIEPVASVGQNRDLDGQSPVDNRKAREEEQKRALGVTAASQAD